MDESSEQHQPGEVIEPGQGKKKDDDKPAWQFRAEDSSSNAATPATRPANIEPVQWTASEFIQHEKSPSWYAGLLLGAVVLAVAVYVLTKNLISTVMVVVVAFFFAVFALRRPRELSYQVDERGVRIGSKFYAYANFKAFSIVQEEGMDSIWLMPLKRFMPILSLYFAPEDGPKIVNVLAQYLPVEEHKLDPVDRLMHRLRF